MTDRSLFSDIPAAAGGGGTITDVAPVPSDPNMRRVKVEGKIVARLPVQAAEALRLEVGRTWTAALAARVREAVETAQARRTALTLLGRRAMSRGELIDRLVRRGHSRALAQRAADGLEADHWIDDTAYATALAEELVRRKGASTAMIVAKLVARNVDEALAAEVAERALGDADPVERATEMARRRLEGMSRATPQAAARRIAGVLARRGFDEETIAAALRRAGLAAD